MKFAAQHMFQGVCMRKIRISTSKKSCFVMLQTDVCEGLRRDYFMFNPLV